MAGNTDKMGSVSNTGRKIIVKATDKSNRKNKICRLIAVLSLELDLVKCIMLSSHGKELAVADRRLPLIRLKYRKKAVRKCATAEDEDSKSESCSAEPPELEPGQVEQDLSRIWNAVKQVIEEVTHEIGRQGIEMSYVESMAITNEMRTVAAWNVETGRPLHNAIHWSDVRMATGRSTGGAIEWLLRHSPAVKCADKSRRFGTLDTWVLWQLTDKHVYVTDATNASYTGLCDIDASEWDRDVCQKLGVRTEWLPKIHLPKFDVCVARGPLVGIPVNTVMARPSATLYGQYCFRRGNAVVTLGSRSAVVLGSLEKRPAAASERDHHLGPTTVIGYREPDKGGETVYGLLAVSLAPQILGWMKRIGIVSSADECMVTHKNAGGRSAESRVYVVPALNGLPYAPYGRADARMIAWGKIDEKTDSSDFVTGAVDSVAFTIADMLECIADRSRVRRVYKVYVDGELSGHESLLDRLAGLSGAEVRRREADMAVHGAARMSKAVNVKRYACRPVYSYHLQSNTREQRLELVERWKRAVHMSYGWIGPKDDFLTETTDVQGILGDVINCYHSAVWWCRSVFYEYRDWFNNYYYIVSDD